MAVGLYRRYRNDNPGACYWIASLSLNAPEKYASSRVMSVTGKSYNALESG